MSQFHEILDIKRGITLEQTLFIGDHELGSAVGEWRRGVVRYHALTQLHC